MNELTEYNDSNLESYETVQAETGLPGPVANPAMKQVFTIFAVLLISIVLIFLLKSLSRVLFVRQNKEKKQIEKNECAACKKKVDKVTYSVLFYPLGSRRAKLRMGNLCDRCRDIRLESVKELFEEVVLESF